MAKRKSLSLAWLRAYLDEGTSTFLNAAAAAARAGYKPKRRDTYKVIGYQNRLKWAPKIEAWLEEHGFSEVRLKTRLLRLMDARETKFEKVKGAVLEAALPEEVRVVATTGTVSLVKYEGELRRAYSDGDTLLAINVQALETQRRTLDMALKMKGLYAPEKHEHSGAIATVTQLTEEDRKLARDFITAYIPKLMEANLVKPT